MRSAPWAPYRPSEQTPWNWARAWTLRRRAGFAATGRELERDVADGPALAVDRVLAGACRLDGVPADFDSTAELLGASAAGSSDPRRLQAWWLFRMLATPDPLPERVTLMWHNHFATSQLKVDDVAAMYRQNGTLRRLGLGPFGDLLRAMLRDPALLVWLDAPSNRKDRPNENLGRELLELFTLGVGHYTEADVKAAARALTGRTVVRGEFQVRPGDHDDGDKILLGQTARYDGDTLADRLLTQPALADRLAWRLADTFLGEGVADRAALAALAVALRADDLHIGRGIALILRSELFFTTRNLHAKVADPVGFAVGAARALERFDPRPSTLLLAEWTDRLGQNLFFPPNVGGWPGGRAWLSGRSVVARANYAAALANGTLNANAQPPDFAGLPSLDLLLTGRSLDFARPTDRDQINHAVALLLARPEAQLV